VRVTSSAASLGGGKKSISLILEVGKSAGNGVGVGDGGGIGVTRTVGGGLGVVGTAHAFITVTALMTMTTNQATWWIILPSTVMRSPPSSHGICPAT